MVSRSPEQTPFKVGNYLLDKVLRMCILCHMGTYQTQNSPGETAHSKSSPGGTVFLGRGQDMQERHMQAETYGWEVRAFAYDPLYYPSLTEHLKTQEQAFAVAGAWAIAVFAAWTWAAWAIKFGTVQPNHFRGNSAPEKQQEIP